jgi:sulfite exporter TauE/SafE
MTATLLAAAALGVVGSLHCIGMCGPLVVAGASRGGRLSLAALGSYLLGRLCSYALVGAVMGGIGAQALHRVPAQPFQAGMAIVIAAFAAGKGYRALARNRPRVAASATPRSERLLVWIVRWLPRRGLGLGLATGFLPCGLLVAGWLLAASSGSAARGSLTMSVLFGATTPALVLPVALVRLAQGRRLAFPNWAQGAGWIALAAWLAVRPLLAMSHHH